MCLSLLAGAAVAVPVATIFRQILLVVFAPMAAGWLTRQAIIRHAGRERFQKVWAPRFPALSTAGVLAIVFVAMDLKARAILEAPGLVLTILGPLVLLYVINFSLSTWIARRAFPYEDAVALVYGTAMRNLSIALAIAMSAFGEKGADVALVIAAAYVIQVQAGAWYVRFVPRLFGTAVAEEEAQAG